MGVIKKPDPVDTHVGSRIRFRRLKIGQTQEGLSNLIGVTFQQVQKYEKGYNRVGASRMVQIANAQGVTPDYYYVGAPGAAAVLGKSSGADVGLKAITSERAGLAIIEAYAKLTARQRRIFADLIEAFAEVRAA